MAGLGKVLKKAIAPKTEDIIKGARKEATIPGVSPKEVEELSKALERLDTGETLVDPNAAPGATVDPDATVDPATGAPVADPPPAGVDAPGAPLTTPVSPLEPATPEQTQKIMEGLVDDTEPPNAILEKRTEKRNANIQRHHDGAIANNDPNIQLEQMETSDQVAKLLDVTANELGLGHVTRTHKSLEVVSPERMKEVLGPVLRGEQTGLMNDQQLLVARNWLATLGDELAVLGKDIKGGDHRPEVVLKWQEKAQRFAGLQRFVSGQVTEVARALSQQNAIAKVLRNGNITDIMAELEAQGGSKESIIRLASNMADNVEAAAARGEAGDMVTAGAIAKSLDNKWQTRFGAAVEFWKNNILSGVKTHAVNVSMNFALGINEVFVRVIAGALGSSRRAAGIGADDAVTLTEAMVYSVSTYSGMRDGARMMYQTLKTKESAFGGGKGELPRMSLQEQAWLHTGVPPAVAKRLGDAGTLSFRVLGAEDEFFRTWAYRQEAVSLVTRDGITKGLQGDALAKHIGDSLEDLPAGIHEAATQFAQRQTFTQSKIGPWADAVAHVARKLTTEIPIPFGFVAPFIKTPISLFHRTLEITGIGAPFTKAFREDWKAGGARRDMANARFLLGTAQMGGMYALYESGLVTGDGPKDANLRRELEKTGWQPNAIRFGDTYVSMKRADPFATALFAWANTMDKAKYSRTKKGWEDNFAEAIMQLGAHMSDSTYLSGLNNLLDAFENPNMLKRLLANTASGFVPYSGLLKSVKDVADPTDRRSSVTDRQRKVSVGELLLNSVKGRLPVASEQLRPKRYWDGKPALPGMGTFAYASSPFKVGKAGERDPANEELIRQGVGLGEPSPVISLKGVSFSLLHLDEGAGMIYDKYFELVGKYRREILEKTINSSSYSRLGDPAKGPGGSRPDEAVDVVGATGSADGPGSRRHHLLQNAARRAQRIAMLVFVKSHLTPEIEEILEKDPDMLGPLAQKFGIDGMGLRQFVKAARRGLLDTEIEKLLTVRGRGDQGALPLPPHLPQF